MKQILSLVVIMAVISLRAQVGINADENTIAEDAVFHVKNVDNQYKGVLIPKLSTEERNKITSPTEGLMIYNTTLHCLEVFNGTSWGCGDHNIPKASATLELNPLRWFAMEYEGTYYNRPRSNIASNGSISFEIPYSNASYGNYEAYSQTLQLLDKDNTPREFRLSYPAGMIVNSTGVINATLTNISGVDYSPKPQPIDGQYYDLATVQVTFNGGGATPFKVQAMGGIPDKKFGDGAHNFVYLPVQVTANNGYNKTWLNMNLGAEAAKVSSPDFNPTLVKTGEEASYDTNLFGSLYQWQRPTDGHEFRESDFINDRADNWTATSPSDVVGLYIIAQSSQNYNWVKNGAEASGANLQLWRAGKPNNPCPTGYHVPELKEWEDFFKAVTKNPNPEATDNTNAMFYQSYMINLPAAGIRSDEAGIDEIEREGFYASSSSVKEEYPSANGGYSCALNFNNQESKIRTDFYRVYGSSVRCIKD